MRGFLRFLVRGNIDPGFSENEAENGPKRAESDRPVDTR